MGYRNKRKEVSSDDEMMEPDSTTHFEGDEDDVRTERRSGGRDDDRRSQRGSQGSGRGSSRGSGRGNGRGGSQGSGQGSGRSSGRGGTQGSGQGSGRGSGRGNGQGNGQGSGRGSGRGSSRGSGGDRPTSTSGERLRRMEQSMDPTLQGLEGVADIALKEGCPDSSQPAPAPSTSRKREKSPDVPPPGYAYSQAYEQQWVPIPDAIAGPPPPPPRPSDLDYLPASILQQLPPVRRTFTKTVADQLTQMGRVFEDVPGDGNCLFESVSRQINIAGYSHAHLRDITVKLGRERVNDFEGFLLGGRREYLEEVNKLEQDAAWSTMIGDIVLTLLYNVLERRIVVLRNAGITLYFPDDGNKTIDARTIVVIHDDMQSHYSSTRPASLQPYSGIKEQVRGLNRRVAPVFRDGDAVFESIALQITDSNPGMNREILRYLAACYAPNFITKYEKGFTKKNRELLDYDLRVLAKPNVWHPRLMDFILFVLSHALDRKIAVIRAHARPITFPIDEAPITADYIIIVQSSKDAYQTAGTTLRQ